jgi:hypothetical protein
MAVVILFSLGFIVTVAGIVRTYYIYQSVVASYDQTWQAYPLWICAAIEIDLGVVRLAFPPRNVQDQFQLTILDLRIGAGPPAPAPEDPVHSTYVF